MATKKKASTAKKTKAVKKSAAPKVTKGGKDPIVAKETKETKPSKSKGTKVLFIKSPTGLFKLAHGVRDTETIDDKDLLEKMLKSGVATTDLEYFTNKAKAK